MPDTDSNRMDRMDRIKKIWDLRFQIFDLGCQIWNFMLIVFILFILSIPVNLFSYSFAVAHS